VQRRAPASIVDRMRSACAIWCGLALLLDPGAAASATAVPAADAPPAPVVVLRVDGAIGAAARQIDCAQAQPDAGADQSGAQQRAPFGASLRSRIQDFRVLLREGDRAPRQLSPRAPLLMLAAHAGRPGPRTRWGSGDGK